MSSLPTLIPDACLDIANNGLIDIEAYIELLDGYLQKNLKIETFLTAVYVLEELKTLTKDIEGCNEFFFASMNNGGITIYWAVEQHFFYVFIAPDQTLKFWYCEKLFKKAFDGPLIIHEDLCLGEICNLHEWLYSTFIKG